jgi:hypothetical protein
MMTCHLYVLVAARSSVLKGIQKSFSGDEPIQQNEGVDPTDQHRELLVIDMQRMVGAAELFIRTLFAFGTRLHHRSDIFDLSPQCGITLLSKLTMLPICPALLQCADQTVIQHDSCIA